MKAAERDSLIRLLKRLDQATLNKVTAGLTWPDKAVLGQRLGLELVPRRSLEQVAKEYGVSMAHIRKIERAALAKFHRTPSREAVAAVSDAVEQCRACDFDLRQIRAAPAYHQILPDRTIVLRPDCAS